MIDEELLNKFDRIQDLPVSEEMLGAYMEGNTSDDESLYIDNLLSFDSSFSSLVDSLGDELEDFNSPSELIDHTAIDLIDLPLFYEESFINQQLTFSEMDNSHSGMDNSYETEGQAALGANAASRLFGEEKAGDVPMQDPMIFQGYEGVCAIRSQQIILRDYGIDIPLEDLKQFAIENGWYNEDGTPMGYVGALLASCGVEVRQDINCTVYDLVNELAQGHRVIVGVDANELWADRNGSVVDQAKTWLEDVFVKEGANHALIVAGVEVNPNDPEDVKVILTDPGTGDLRIEYTLDDFMDAWEDSDCFMTTTTSPAPYQYDPVHGCEVPSNFAVDQYIANNSLPLAPDVRGVEYEVAEGYSAYYSDGHLNSVGTDGNGNPVPYANFSEEYEKCNEEYSKLKQTLGNVPGTLGKDHFDKDEFMSSLKNLFGLGDKPSSDEPKPRIQNSNPNPEPEPDSNNDEDEDNEVDEVDDDDDANFDF